MKARFTLLASLMIGLGLVGCNVGESTAPKPDPNKFLPQDGAVAGPPPSSPSAK